MNQDFDEGRCKEIVTGDKLRIAVGHNIVTRPGLGCPFYRLHSDMGRKPLIEERKHPLYFKMQPLKASALPGAGDAKGDDACSKSPEWFMEQVMEGLSDACMLLDGTGRLIYVNNSAKQLLSPRGRILGRKLEAVLANRQLSMLAADVYHTGKPVFSKLVISMPGERWRDDHSFHLSLVPLWITPTRRLVRIALRDGTERNPAAHSPANMASCDDAAEDSAPPAQCVEAMTKMRTPLSILQGYLENLLDGAIKDPIVIRQSLLTMRKHTLSIEKLLETCRK